MPSVLVPHASASHRVACIRLYRALLKQTSLLQGQTETGRNDALPNVVRYRFRRDRRLVSLKQVADGLNVGYAILDLVHACNNKNGEALAKLASLVESTTAQAEATAAWRSTLAGLRKPPSSAILAKVRHIKAVADKTNHVRHPGSKPILERPLPLAEIRGGTRRVPNLVTAHGIPFLRYSKPQPISLRRVIRQKVLWNEKNWTRRGVLEEQILLAEFEDEWDRILTSEHGISDVHCEDLLATFAEPSWTEEFHNADEEIFEAIRARDEKCAEMGEKMWEVVKQEKALKMQEKIERGRGFIMATKPRQQEDLPSLKDLASSDARLRRLSFQQILTHISDRITPLTHAQCLQLWRGFFVALYMHDSKSMISVQNLTTSLADQFTVIAGKDAENQDESTADGGASQLGVFSEAFWETMAREWSAIDVHRMNKILLLIRLVTRSIFKICMPSAEEGNERPSSTRDTNEQCIILEKWPLSLRERKVPDGLRYHVLDIWVDELEEAGLQTNIELHEECKNIEQRFMEPVEKLAKGGLTKPVRTRAKETLVAAKEVFDYGESETDET